MEGGHRLVTIWRIFRLGVAANWTNSSVMKAICFATSRVALCNGDIKIEDKSMKTLLIASALVLAALPAHAVSRYNSQGMSCDTARSRIADEGAVILRYKSKNNPSLTLFDRYVAGDQYCAAGQYAKFSPVPTSDNASCMLALCADAMHDDSRDGGILPK